MTEMQVQNTKPEESVNRPTVAYVQKQTHHRVPEPDDLLQLANGPVCCGNLHALLQAFLLFLSN